MPVHLTDRVRLYVVALLSCVVMALAIAAFTKYLPGFLADVDPPLVRFIVVTVVLPIYCLHAYRHLLRSIKFWGIFICFIAVHIFIVGEVYELFGGLPFELMVIAAYVEVVVLGFTIHWVLRALPDLRVSKSKSPWIPTL